MQQRVTVLSHVLLLLVQVGEEEWGGQGARRVLEEVDPTQGADI
jgi:hypothetical protein